MQIIRTGMITRATAGTRQAVYTFPSVTVLSDGTLLATCRAGSSKDTADETVELYRSDDGGITWSKPMMPFGEARVDGAKSSFRVCYITELAPDRLLAASMWLDRETLAGEPFFNPRTEGCLPMGVFLAESGDQGRTWSAWRHVPLPDEIGPPSLTNPIMQLPDGRLVMSIETNKSYHDTSKWYQRVVHFYSDDDGQNWTGPVISSVDPEARIFHWDQRAGVLPDGRIVTFTWTYDRESNQYLNIYRRVSADASQTWTEPENLGFADQPAHPAILPDGRIVLAWVDRYGSQSIRARVAADVNAPFPAESEVVIYQHQVDAGKSSKDAAEMLQEMNVWSFGLPFAETLPDGNVMVVYYAGDPQVMDVHYAILQP